ncbi:MAG: exodeoxyribonuclease V subunit alpha [bacterium]
MGTRALPVNYDIAGDKLVAVALLRGNAAAGIEAIDFYFGGFINRLSGAPSEELSLAAALASRGLRQGHTCIDINAMGGSEPAPGGKGEPFVCPDSKKWLSALRAASDVVGTPGEFKPMILDAGGRLYLHRYWQYESRLAAAVKSKAAATPPPIDVKRLGAGLNTLFPNDNADGPDLQKVAAFAASKRNFCVISGGPGTGKTTTVMRILALLLEQSPGLRIALTAPTGKAAARLEESVSGSLEKAGLPDAIASAMPREAHTLHTLLGARPDSVRFRHNAGNPLPHDVIVVDEASMVDLAIMSKLMDAIRPEARLILLGDKDQLASVEAGCALGDLFAEEAEDTFSDDFSAEYNRLTGERLASAPGGEKRGKLADCFVLLRKVHRFGAGGAIGRLSRAVNAGDAGGAMAALKSGGAEARWTEAAGPDELYGIIRDRAAAEYVGYLKAGDPAAALELFGRFRILCALREGPFGVETLNRLAERALADAGLISPDGRWYAGRPVMITRNDYNLNLFNGDIGIALPGADGEGLRVFFASSGGAPRAILPARLPAHETAFAMTVHKSQGSEFDSVLMLLPAADSKILTRELLYTGVTRCRRSVEIIGKEEIFAQAVKLRIARSSGLRAAIWGE